MDRVSARNTFIVLLTIVTLTLATFGTMLGMVAAGRTIPDLIVNLGTTLLGLLAGSTISLSAKPRADAAERAASDVAYHVREAAAIPTVSSLEPMVSTLMSTDPTPDVSPEELADDTVPEGGTDAPDPTPIV